jgi:serine/threonine protein phosphatase PrpC
LSSNIRVAALSDVGCVRTNNEDNFGYDPSSDLYVVCDGMGGMAAGEVASSIACSTVISVFAAQPAETPIEMRMSLAIRAANDAVCHSGQLAEHKGMGTTLVAAAVEGSKLLIGNVGDSRAYIFQNGACMQVTIDHSYVNELVRAGTIRIEDIHNLELEQFASVITRAIGAAHDVEPDFFFIDLHEGDAVLLASDGLTRYVEGASIAELVDPTDLEGSCQNLINKAKAAGGADNITCILLRYDAPKEATVEAPAVASAPAEAIAETPVEQVTDAPTEPAVETPVEAVTEAPVEPVAETPVQAAVTDTPAEPAAEAPVEAVEEAPAQAEVDSPVEAATEPPTDAEAAAQAEATAKAVADALAELMSEPSETPAKLPDETSDVPPPHVALEHQV